MPERRLALQAKIKSAIWDEVLCNTKSRLSFGRLSGRRAERRRAQPIETHLRDCVACGELAAQLTNCTARLHEAGGMFDAARSSAQKSWTPPGRQCWCGSRRMTRRCNNASTNSKRRWPRCAGAHGGQSLTSAAAESPARSLAELTRENWEPFLHSLFAIARALCGRTGARLILESGQL
jgi:hypothetical protein